MQIPVLILSFVIFLSAQSNAFVDCFRPLSKSTLAVKKFSSFPVMFWTSQLTTVAVISDLPKNSHERHKMSSTNVVAGTFWATGFIFGYALSGVMCPPNSEVKEQELTEVEMNYYSYQTTKLVFYAYHSVNTAWMILNSAHSSKNNKYQMVAGGILSPFLVDLINRSFFNRQKKSIFWNPPLPIVEEAMIVPSPGAITLKVGLSF